MEKKISEKEQTARHQQGQQLWAIVVSRHCRALNDPQQVGSTRALKPTLHSFTSKQTTEADLYKHHGLNTGQRIGWTFERLQGLRLLTLEMYIIAHKCKIYMCVCVRETKHICQHKSSDLTLSPDSHYCSLTATAPPPFSSFSSSHLHNKLLGLPLLKPP